ncbi:kinase-like domain-containing protein, partial [Massariosphaeria phaeospora]
EIGRGSDGCIVVWRHKKSADIHIVSKQPVDWKARRYLEAELEITKAIGNHPNILQTFGSDEYWLPHGPAIFYEYCELGSAWDYQTELFTTYGEVPEETVWKLMADMSKALHWLQNALDKPYIHNDLKPENILAAKSRSHVWTLNAVPILPDFKICDFARVVDFAGKHGPDCVFNGTPEYAAPISERRPRITPQADIWSLGATLQAFAYGFKPTMTTKTFIATRAKAHQSVPAKHSDFELNKWRDLVPVIYRPLNATAAEQRERWDIPRDERGADLSMEPPMSSALNDWYSMCMQLDQRSRATAADLARWFVPVAERQVRVLYARRRA